MEQQQEEVMGNHQYIKDTFGYEMNLFRYPAGKFSEQSLAVVNNCGYESVFWSFGLSGLRCGQPAGSGGKPAEDEK